jgi:hypothetical protein
MAAQGGEGEHIGLQPGAAGWIGRRERQHYRGHGLISGSIL